MEPLGEKCWEEERMKSQQEKMGDKSPDIRIGDEKIEG